MALEITKDNFETLLADTKLLVVDFWATWCGPCKMVGPHIEALSEEFAGRANIGKCNVDEDNELPARFGVRNIPTILFIKGGELVGKIVGAQSKEALKQEIEKHI